MRQITFLFIALLAFMLEAKAQLTGRLEYSTKDNYENEHIFSLEKQGLLILSFNKDEEKGKRWIRYEVFDTHLKQKSCDSIQIDEDMYLYTHEYENKKIYMVFRQKSGEFAIVAFDPDTRKFHVTDGEYTRKGSMRDIIFGKETAVFSSTQKRLERIGIIQLNTGKSYFSDLHFEGVRDRKIVILGHTVIDNIIYSLVKVEKALYLVRTDINGKQLGTTLLASGENGIILQARISKAGENFFVTGTYSRKGDMAQGIYFAELENWKFKYINFYNFLDFNNFTEYMSAKKQKKVERRKEKAEKDGKEYTLNYNMATHEILTDGKDYFYLGEAFYPTYVTTRINNIVSTTFDGYAYTHAILVKFDKEGKPLWNSCFPMKPSYKPFYIKQFVSAGLEGNNINLLYANHKNFVSKLFNNKDGKVIRDKNVEQIETTDGNDKVKKANPANSLHWYDNHFLVFGTQVIKNSESGERRKVVYINKYTIQ